MRKIFLKLAAAIFLVTALQARAQGTLVFDQQSATAPEKGVFDSFDLYKQLFMESFVPTLSSIGFVQLQLWDYLDTNTTGARMAVGVYSGSPSDPTLLASTELVYLPPDFNNLESDTFSDWKQVFATVFAGHFFNSKRASLRAVPIH